MLDLDTGGGEMLAGLPKLPPVLVGAEGYMPNVVVAARRLQPRGAYVVAAHSDRPALPFRADTFDLVTSRHPVVTWWDEIARVLQPGGTYLSQQVGPGERSRAERLHVGSVPAELDTAIRNERSSAPSRPACWSRNSAPYAYERSSTTWARSCTSSAS